MDQEVLLTPLGGHRRYRKSEVQSLLGAAKNGGNNG
jgi:hypothetical protein